MRCMSEKFQCICNELKNEDEFAVIKEYGNGAKRFSLIITRKKFTDISYTIQSILNFIKAIKFWQYKINS